MYCKYCGAPTDNVNSICNACGGYVPPRRRQPAKPKGVMGTIKGCMHLIVAVFTIVMFVFSILNLFSIFDVLVTTSYAGFTTSEYMSTGETSDYLSIFDWNIGAVYAGNIIFGLFGMLGAIIGILYTLKRMMGMGLYSQLVGRYVGRFGGPAMLMGVLGVTGALLQVILYLLCSNSNEEYYEISIGVNWTTWMLLVLYAGLIVLDILIPKNKRRR